MNAYASLEEWYEAGAADANPPQSLDHLRSPASRIAVFLIASAWGLVTAFSGKLGTEAELGGVLILQGAALVGAFVLFLLVDASILTVWISTGAGALISLHAFFAMLSGMTNQATIYQTIRYGLLIPAFCLMIATVRLGPVATARMRMGLTIGGLGMAVYHLALANLSMLFNSGYRLGRDAGFANPNALGFIAMAAAISLLGYALTSLRRKRVLAFLLWCACLAVCLIAVFFTRSRTAAIAGLFGINVYVFLWLGRMRMLAIVLVGVLVLALVFGRQIGSEVSDVYQLEDSAHGRDITTATGRTGVWRHVIHDVWMPNFAFGAGPQPLYSHNGWLENLGQVGFFGTLPLFLIVVWAVVRAWRYRRSPSVWFAASLTAMVLVETMAEAALFSIGNPSSLLFVLSIAILTAAPLDDWARQSESSALPAAARGHGVPNYQPEYESTY